MMPVLLMETHLAEVVQWGSPQIIERSTLALDQYLVSSRYERWLTVSMDPPGAFDSAHART